MAKAGSVAIGIVAVILGLFFGFVGVTFLLENPSLGSADSESSTFLGLFERSESSAGVPTAPWMGFVFLLVGAGLLTFGLRALFVTFEGQRADSA